MLTQSELIRRESVTCDHQHLPDRCSGFKVLNFAEAGVPLPPWIREFIF